MFKFYDKTNPSINLYTAVNGLSSRGCISLRNKLILIFIKLRKKKTNYNRGEYMATSLFDNDFTVALLTSDLQNASIISNTKPKPDVSLFFFPPFFLHEKSLIFQRL